TGVPKSGEFVSVRFGCRRAEPFLEVKVNFLDEFTDQIFVHGMPKGATSRFLGVSHPRRTKLVKQYVSPFLSFTPLQCKLRQPETLSSTIELIRILDIRSQVENDIPSLR